MGFWAGVGGGILGKAIDFGFGAASSALSYKYMRKARRTQFQDTMHSMRQAGLNPILAAGAQSPTSWGPSADTGESMGNVIEKSLNIKQAQEIVKNLKKEGEATDARAALDRENTELAAQKQAESILAQMESIERSENLRLDRDVKRQVMQQIQQVIAESKARTPTYGVSAAEARARIPLHRARGRLAETEIPSAEALEAMFDNPEGAGFKQLMTVLRMIVGSYHGR